MNEIILEGCRTAPLSSYLKALGITRLIAEQADNSIRAYWGDNQFVVRTALTKDEVFSFFLYDYAPSPIVAPWAGGSGFYQGDEKKGFDLLRKSSLKRFENYKNVINEIASWSEMPKNYETLGEIIQALSAEIASKREGKSRDDMVKVLEDIEREISNASVLIGEDIKPHTSLEQIEKLPKQFKGAQKKQLSAAWQAVRKGRTKCVGFERSSGKKKLLPFTRSRLPDEAVNWLDAVFSLRGDDSAVYNPVLGTGGNEGRLDFTNNFMQRVVELFMASSGVDVGNMLKNSLFDEPVEGLWKASVGQYDPGRAGGYNQGAEIETKNFKINPWNFILMIEGTLFFAGTISKRCEFDVHGWGALPFTVRHSGVGFSSSEHSELGRAETWLPIWHNPTGVTELRQLFSEGRASLGRRTVSTGLDFVRCLSSLGVDRGIDGFERYAFLERRGTNYVALPAGRHSVFYDSGVKILNDLDPMLQKLDGFLRRFVNIPASFGSARRRIDEAMYECAVAGSPAKFSNLVRALGRMEYLIAQRDRSKDPKISQPLSGLRPQWFSACDTGDVEVRIAAALASVHGTREVGPIRSNLAGVDPSAPWKWAGGHGQKRWVGNTLTERLTAVLIQRMMDAKRYSLPHAPLGGFVPIQSEDIVAFLSGETDDVCIEELLWGFSLIRKEKGVSMPIPGTWRSPVTASPIPRDWAMLKLLFLPFPLRGVSIPMETRIVSYLSAGRTMDAVEQGLRRLRSSDLNPLPVEAGEWIGADRLVAGLMIPVADPGRLASLVLKKEKETK